ncbi:MAG TPA: hypothetical protein VN922_05740 [Bacteroidia bacterium]|nr:hypothetical protein [Bacteroidia bacterium]
MKISSWKYKPSPFNILALIFTGCVVFYFIKASGNEYYDKHGWEAAFVLLPSMLSAIVLSTLDLILQLAIKLKYKWVLIIELSLILINLFWFTPFSMFIVGFFHIHI